MSYVTALGQRAIYEFWLGGRYISGVIAYSLEEARAKADAEADMMCDRPYETPCDRVAALRYARVSIHPLPFDPERAAVALDINAGESEEY